MPNAFNPSFLSFNLPSGNVSQSFAPFFTQQVGMTYAGNREIEERVVADVASFGRQIGRLLDAVVLLARDRPEPEFATLRTMAAEIKRVKEETRSSALRDARAALDALARADPKGVAVLLEGYAPPVPRGSP